MEASIKLTFETRKKAEAVAKAIAPENVEVPPGLFVKTTKRGTQVITQIRCETRLRTFMATVDDLLAAVSVAEKALSAIK